MHCGRGNLRRHSPGRGPHRRLRRNHLRLSRNRRRLRRNRRLQLQRRQSKSVPATPPMCWSRTEQVPIAHLLLRFASPMVPVFSTVLAAVSLVVAQCPIHGCYIQILRHGIKIQYHLEASQTLCSLRFLKIFILLDDLLTLPHSSRHALWKVHHKKMKYPRSMEVQQKLSTEKIEQAKLAHLAAKEQKEAAEKQKEAKKLELEAKMFDTYNRLMSLDKSLMSEEEKEDHANTIKCLKKRLFSDFT